MRLPDWMKFVRWERTHLAPLGDDAVTRCCGRSPFDLPATDRMSENPADVTCGRAVTAILSVRSPIEGSTDGADRD